MIAIIDYDAGNIKSVEKALQLLGEDVAVTRDAGVIKSAERVIPSRGGFIRGCDGEPASLFTGACDPRGNRA